MYNQYEKEDEQMADLRLVNVKKVYPISGDSAKKARRKKSGGKQSEENKNSVPIKDQGVVAVQEFNLDIADKEFIVLVGPSGCGKSTTLRMVAGLEEISDGELYIGGERMNDVLPRDRDIAMVFQNYALYPHMSVYENVAFPLKLCKEPRAEIDRKVRETAEILDITELLDRKPKALSGGQRQRVAIGRAIVREPKVLLMDEPLSNLDAKLRNQMRVELLKLRQKIDTTFIYVTHDQTEAMTLGDRIVVMKDGFIQQVGAPQDVFDHPNNLFVAGFIGSPKMNFFNAKLVRANGRYAVEVGGLSVDLSTEKQDRLSENNVPEQDVILGVRPEHLRLSGRGVPATIDVSELVGSSTYVHVTAMGQDVTLSVSTANMIGSDVVSLTYGSQVALSFDGTVCHVFSKDTHANLEAQI